MKIKCIRCKKEYDTDTYENYICTSCVKEIIQNNGNLAEEYVSLTSFKDCRNCIHNDTPADKNPCKDCDFYSDFELNWKDN